MRSIALVRLSYVDVDRWVAVSRAPDGEDLIGASCCPVRLYDSDEAPSLPS